MGELNNKSLIDSCLFDVMSYFDETGALGGRKVKKSELKNFWGELRISPATYLIQKNCFLNMVTKINKKFKCRICNNVFSVIFRIKSKSRCCIDCKENLSEHERKSRKVYEYKRRRLTKLTCDGSINKEFLEKLISSQNNKCNYCEISFDNAIKNLDHIYPISKGGTHTSNNVQFLCWECNIKKSDKIV